MKIVFISDFSFPIGMASTNRIISLAKGLVNNNNCITIFITKPTEKSSRIINHEKEGIFNGINFIYTSGTPIRSKSRIKLIYLVLKGFFGFFSYFHKYNKKDKIDFVISFSPKNYLFNYLYVKFIKFNGATPVLAIDEFPYVVRHHEKFPKWYISFIKKNYFKQFYGLIIMTNTLIKYFKPLIKPSAFIIHLPMTVEIERFTSDNSMSPIKGKYIAYSGSFVNNKDGIPILIKAFDKVRREISDIKLVIIGGGNIGEDKDFNDFRNIVKELNIENMVVFTGYVSSESIPKYLNNATVLALARPDNIQSKGGFPTKLGEYLATGNPVVVTMVGEITDYLDESCAYLAEPDSVNSFSRKLKEALIDSNRKTIGNKGRDIAMKYFDHKIQGKRLSDQLYKVKLMKNKISKQI